MQKSRFGAEVRRLRLQQGRSLRSFAKDVGLSPSFISQLEAGKASAPGVEKILAIARALGADGDEMLAFAGRMRGVLKPQKKNSLKLYVDESVFQFLFVNLFSQELSKPKYQKWLGRLEKRGAKDLVGFAVGESVEHLVASLEKELRKREGNAPPRREWRTNRGSRNRMS
jgi:transcriptional regulator with XRE-family HTH domain